MSARNSPPLNDPDRKAEKTRPQRPSPDPAEREPMVRRDRYANASPQPGKDKRRNRAV